MTERESPRATIKICSRCGNQYICEPESDADRTGLCWSCYKPIVTTTPNQERVDASEVHKSVPSEQMISHHATDSTPKYEQRPLTYYVDSLAKFDISDCLTFEAVKQKFPDSDEDFLRKLVHLRGLEIGDDGLLEATERRITEYSSHEVPTATIANESLTDAYRVPHDLSLLPRMRVEEHRQTDRSEEVEIEAPEWPDNDESEEFKPLAGERRHRRRIYGLGGLDDKGIFSQYEMEREVDGYCEECTNYGSLLYVNGLYLCEICERTLRIGGMSKS